MVLLLLASPLAPLALPLPSLPMVCLVNHLHTYIPPILPFYQNCGKLNDYRWCSSCSLWLLWRSHCKAYRWFVWLIIYILTYPPILPFYQNCGKLNDYRWCSSCSLWLLWLLWRPILEALHCAYTLIQNIGDCDIPICSPAVFVNIGSLPPICTKTKSHEAFPL